MPKPGATDGDRRLTAIEVTGFKSAMDPVRLNLRDISILAGVNSAGKSAIMQPLLLIKQTIEKPFDPGGLAIDGPLVHFTTADQFLARGPGRSMLDAFGVTFCFGNSRIGLRYSRSVRFGLDISVMLFTDDGQEICWNEGQSFSPGYLEKNISDLPRRLQIISNMGKHEPFQPRMVRAERGALALDAVYDESRGVKRFERVWSPASPILDDARNLIYLPGLRGNPERHYASSATGPQYPGNFNDYVASIVHHWTTTPDPRLDRLGKHLKLLGLTGHVTATRVDDTRVEVRVGRLPPTTRGKSSGDTVNIADVGFGVSQTLPVLVALLAAMEGQILLIEQPELHLHPKAQVALADPIIESAQRGVRVIIETHSSLLVSAIQAAIAEGRIAPARVSLNWFTRDTMGQTHVSEARIADDGSYGDWPEDFGAIELDLQDRYMTLVERRHARG
jgi:hypothetical protein